MFEFDNGGDCGISGGLWDISGGGGARETARWKSMIGSLRRSNDSQTHDHQVQQLVEDNARLRFCLTSLLELLLERRVIQSYDVEALKEAIALPATVQTQWADTSAELASLSVAVEEAFKRQARQDSSATEGEPE